MVKDFQALGMKKLDRVQVLNRRTRDLWREIIENEGNRGILDKSMFR